MGVGRRVVEAWGGVAAEILLDHEGFGARQIGVDVIGLGHQVGRGGRTRAGFIGEVKTIKIGVALAGVDQRLEGGGHAVGHADIDKPFDAGRQVIEHVRGADVREVEAIRGRRVDAIHEIAVRRVMQRRIWTECRSHLPSQIAGNRSPPPDQLIVMYDGNVANGAKTK